METLPYVLALRVDENIFFANAAQIEDKLLKRAQRRQGTRHLLIVCSSVNAIDATGIQMLLRLNANLTRAGITLNMCDVKGGIKLQLDVLGVTGQLSGQIFFNADRAMKQFAEKLRDAAENAETMPSV